MKAHSDVASPTHSSVRPSMHVAQRGAYLDTRISPQSLPLPCLHGRSGLRECDILRLAGLLHGRPAPPAVCPCPEFHSPLQSFSPRHVRAGVPPSSKSNVPMRVKKHLKLPYTTCLLTTIYLPPVSASDDCCCFWRTFDNLEYSLLPTSYIPPHASDNSP